MYLLKVFISIVVFIRFNCINCDKYTDWQSLINASVVYRENLDLDYFKNIVNSSRISQECEKSISQTLRSLNNFDDWSYQMYNSWSDFPPKGVMEGTVTDFGDYDQCLSITPNEVIGESQYCLIDISIPLPTPMSQHQNLFHRIDVLPQFMNKSENNIFVKLSKDAAFFHWFFFRLGICTPSKCTQNHIKAIAIKSLQNSGLVLKAVNCETNTTESLNVLQVLALLLLFSFIFAITFSTIALRVLDIKKNSILSRIFQAFSLTSNINKLFTTRTSHELSCIHGIRVITIIWVIVGHSLEWAFWGIYGKLFEMKVLFSAPENQIILQAFYSVETFFFISGLLTTYMTLKLSEGIKEQFNKVGFIISRYIRLTPQLGIFMLLSTLLPLLGSGPIWRQQIGRQVNKCYKNWWQNLIYAQNFIDPQYMCGEHTWFLAADMQYHWISLIAIIALHRNIKFGLIVNAVITFAFIAISSIMIFINDYPPAVVPTSKADNMVSGGLYSDYLLNFYYKPWPHGSVFFIGLAFGYIVYRIKPKKLSNIKRLSIWIFIMFGFIATLYDNRFWVYGEPYNRWISALFYPITRIIWAISIALTIWMCITGNGSFVNTFLSWKPFIPISRLTYSLYLTHAWIVWIYWGSRRNLIDIKKFTILSIVCGTLLMSLFTGFVFSVIFESPFLALQNNLKQHLLCNHKKNNNNNIYIKPNNFDENPEIPLPISDENLELRLK